MGKFADWAKSLSDFTLTKGWTKAKEAEYTEDVYDDEGYYESEEPAPSPTPSPGTRSSFDDPRPFSVIYMSKSQRDSNAAGHAAPAPGPHAYQPEEKSKIHLAFPKSIDDCGKISGFIRDSYVVIVNLESIKFDIAQRIVDFCSGLVHAVSGEIEDIANKTFILMPKGVELSGKIREDIESGIYDVPTFRAVGR
jgi:cell division inhibitor SepF